MSASEDLRGTLAGDVERNRTQTAIAEETRLIIAAAARDQFRMMRDDMTIAISEGVASLMTEENAERFWTKGIEVLQRQAKERAGTFLLDGFTAALKKLLWIGAIVLGAWSFGGWALAKTIWAALTPKG